MNRRTTHLVAKFTQIACLTALIAVFTAPSAHAAILPAQFINISEPIAGTPLVSVYTIGYNFTVGTRDIIVTALGYYDGPTAAFTNTLGDGLSGSHTIGIWPGSAAQTPTPAVLVSASVPAGTAGTLVGGFRYINLAPANQITLLAGHTYTVGGTFTSPDQWRYSVTNVQYSRDITDVHERYGGGSSLVYPANGPFGNTSQLVGGSFLYQPAPEPASIALLAVGGLVLAAPRRRR